MIILTIFYGKLNLKNLADDNKSMKNYPACIELTNTFRGGSRISGMGVQMCKGGGLALLILSHFS